MPILESTVRSVIDETNRVNRLAHAALERIKSDKYATITGSKETAALRRASMDLTRLLALLRKPRY